MQTPRPDHFTYPHGRQPAGKPRPDDLRGGEILLKRPWMRAVFFGGLVAAFGLGLALSLAA